MPTTEVNIQVQKKHSLEFSFKTKLRKFFRKIALDVKLSLSVVRQPINMVIYQPELVTLLREQYRRTSNSFLKIGEQSLAKHLIVDKHTFDCLNKKITFITNNKQAEQEIALQVNNDNNLRSDTQAGIILSTTEKVLTRSIERINTQKN